MMHNTLIEKLICYLAANHEKIEGRLHCAYNLPSSLLLLVVVVVVRLGTISTDATTFWQ